MVQRGLGKRQICTTECTLLLYGRAGKN